jgi:hypothetical protein
MTVTRYTLCLFSPESLGLGYTTESFPHGFLVFYVFYVFPMYNY